MPPDVYGHCFMVIFHGHISPMCVGGAASVGDDLGEVVRPKTTVQSGLTDGVQIHKKELIHFHFLDIQRRLQVLKVQCAPKVRFLCLAEHNHAVISRCLFFTSSSS